MASLFQKAALLLLLALAGPAWAQNPGVSAAFSEPTAVVGEPVQFTITIQGADNNGLLPRVRVDGLDFDYLGPQSRNEVRFDNGRLTRNSSVSHVFQVTPRRAGSFTVPSLAIDVNGRVVRTEPVTLNVGAPGAAPPPGGGGIDPAAKAEVVLPKKSAYVGETLPVSLRLLVDSQIRWEQEQPPSFEGEGYTKAKPTSARSDTIVRNGRSYDALSFYSAITPSRAGKLNIGPVTFLYRAQVPRAQRNRRQGFGGGLLDDFFNDPFGNFSVVQRKTAVSDAAELEVKPLPTQGRPANFSGAVGQFSLSAEGSPARVKVGDPITMAVRVTGTGNFDRVSAPVLAESKGWRAYPPTGSFRADDELALKGTKTFEIAVVPEAKQDHMPEYEFVYFDPANAKYVTLRTPRLPLQVEGEALPGPPPPREPARVESAPATPPPAAPPPKPTDIYGIRYDFGNPTAARPFYTQRGFLLAQLVPLCGLAGLVAVRFWPVRGNGPAAASLRRERDRLLGKLRGTKDREAFYDRAARTLQLEGALRTGQAPETIDAHTLARLDPEQGKLAEEVFSVRGEALYAGTGAAGAPLESSERERVLAALQAWVQKK